MKNRLRYIMLTVLGSMITLTVSAQKVTLSGTVVDATTNTPMPGATILAEGSPGAISGQNGTFTISGLKLGVKNSIEVSFLGYKNAVIEYTPEKTNNKLDKPVQLTPESLNAGEVVVQGRAPIAKQMGDTVQYNADAFKVNPDATAADLVAKMPGMKVENGTPSQGGESITRIYVDGKSFFRDDPATALASLPADAIEGIQVYEELSDEAKFSGIDDGERTKTINIVTKAKRKDAYFGDYTVGYGTDNHYNVKANTNIFYDNHRLTVGFGLNDINQPATSGGRFYGAFGRSGLQTAAGVKLNYSGEFTNKKGYETNASIDYVFNNNKNDSYNSSVQDWNATSSFDTRRYTEEYKSNTNNFSHSLRANIESQLGANDRIIFRPNFSYTTSEENQITKMLTVQDGITTNDAITNQFDKSKSFKTGATFNWMHNFAPKHTISLRANFSIAKDDASSIIEGNNNFLREDEWIDSLINQNTDEYDIDNTIGGRLSYTYKVGKNSSLMANYNVSYTWNDTDKKTYVYDPASGMLSTLDPNLSNIFARDYLTNSGGLGYNYRIKNKITFNVSANFQNATLQSRYTLPTDDIYDYSFNSVVANMRFDYYFTESRRLSMFFRGRPSLPSMSQLQNVVDNTNPLNVTVGNPNLKQSYNNMIGIVYFNTNIEKSNTTMFHAFFNSTANSFANDIRILDRDEIINNVNIQQGAQVSSPVNIDGKWSFSSMFDYSVALPRIKSNISTGVRYSLSHTPSIYNGVKSITMSNGGGVDLALTSNISENIDFTVRSETNLTYSSGTNARKTTYINERASVVFNWIFWKGFFINADYSYNFNWYSTGSPQNNYNLLNAGIGKKFLKNQNAEIRISGFDLLNQAKSISYTVNDNYTQNVISNVLQRYVMLTFSYKFNTMKGGSTAAAQSTRRPGMGGAHPMPPMGRP